MKLNMDFSIIIAVLVLVQLFILNIKVNGDSKSEEIIKTDNNINEDPDDIFLVVHRKNGEKKVYSKKDVA